MPEGDYYGGKLLQIVESINKTGSLSGRSLTQLPEMSILRYLQEDQCDLDAAFRFIDKSIREMTNPCEDEGITYDNLVDTPEIQRQKRHRDEEDIDRALDVVERFVATLRTHTKRAKGEERVV